MAELFSNENIFMAYPNFYENSGWPTLIWCISSSACRNIIYTNIITITYNELLYILQFLIFSPCCKGWRKKDMIRFIFLLIQECQERNCRHWNIATVLLSWYITTLVFLWNKHIFTRLSWLQYSIVIHSAIYCLVFAVTLFTRRW